MNELRKLYIDKIYNSDKVGYPMSPGRWVGSEKYIPVVRIKMTSGGGIGGASWYELVKGLTLEDLTAERVLKVKTYDDKTLILNLDYMVAAEPLTMMVRTYHSENPYYAKGDYKVFRLLEENSKVTEFVNELER